MSFMDSFIAPYPLERQQAIIMWPPDMTITIKKHDQTMIIKKHDITLEIAE